MPGHERSGETGRPDDQNMHSGAHCLSLKVSLPMYQLENLRHPILPLFSSVSFSDVVSTL